MRYRIMKGGSHTRFEDGMAVTYSRGDVIDLNEEEAGGNSLGGRVELVGSPPDFGESFALAALGEVDVSFLHAGNWRSVVKAIGGIDDIETLTAAVALEDEGRARKSVMKALAARIAELEG